MTDNKILKILIFGLLVVLFLTIVGVNDSYGILKWDVFVAGLFLGLLSLSTRRYYWAVIFIVFAALFNPWIYPSLSKTTWIIADTLLFVALTGWFFDYFKSYRKGLLFEHFVQNSFAEPEYILVNATKDLHKKLRRFVESDANPDFVFREKRTGKVFAVECKYRADFVEANSWGWGVWWNKAQGDRYLKYSQQENIPVYIAVGVEGNPKNPKYIGYIPIEVIQKQYFKFIPAKVIEQHSFNSIRL
ncbi:MAG: DUF6804 family protein [Candidatus Paceibacterota bacterium]|jgi:hypothetical protein